MKIKIGILLLFVLVQSCRAFIYDDDIVDYKYSPDGKYIAISYISSGGATTPFSVNTSIIKSNKKFKNESGNIFYGYRSTYINIHWKDRYTLVIEHAADDDKIFKKEDVFEEIAIEYIYNIENKRYYGNSIDYKIPKGYYMDLPRDEYGWVIHE
jgi:hypothetical protein